MADDGCAVVLLHAGCKIGREEILALLEEAGFDPSKVIFLEAAEKPDCSDLGAAPVIIPVDDESGDLPELDYAGRCSGHVVVLLGPDCSFEGLHPLAQKYGTQCGWSADQLRACVSSTAEPPQDASGAALQWDDPKPVICKRAK
ncbi:MAG TPA: hypothetical protein VF655_01510 [Allosphingosinicella sp.]